MQFINHDPTPPSHLTLNRTPEEHDSLLLTDIEPETFLHPLDRRLLPGTKGRQARDRGVRHESEQIQDQGRGASECGIGRDAVLFEEIELGFVGGEGVRGGGGSGVGWDSGR